MITRGPTFDAYAALFGKAGQRLVCVIGNVPVFEVDDLPPEAFRLVCSHPKGSA